MTSLLLNFAHAIDHLVLLIFATAVGAIAADFGIGRWEDLMPYTAGAFVMFGLGSLPSGRLGDLWGRRAMMLVFFFGIGVSTMLVAATQNPWQLAAGFTTLLLTMAGISVLSTLIAAWLPSQPAPVPATAEPARA